jgi:D-alanyl-D-alanine carboxypeptidase (penicillin-binding protein 5/6)
MELQLGEKITVKSLVQACLSILPMIPPIHWPTLSGGLSAFVEQMNSLMIKYNLTHTHFVNVDGIHNDAHYSTVYDLSQSPFSH